MTVKTAATQTCTRLRGFEDEPAVEKLKQIRLERDCGKCTAKGNRNVKAESDRGDFSSDMELSTKSLTLAARNFLSKYRGSERP